MNQNLKLSSALKTKVHTLSLLYSDPFMTKNTDCEDNYISAQGDNFTKVGILYLSRRKVMNGSLSLFQGPLSLPLFQMRVKSSGFQWTFNLQSKLKGDMQNFKIFGKVRSFCKQCLHKYLVFLN